MTELRYLRGYPDSLLASAEHLVREGRATAHLAQRYPETHDIRSDGALIEYVGALKARHMRMAPPVAKVAFDSRLELVHQALGTHTAVSRVHGRQLKAKREIRIAAVFKDAPADFLRLIVVHELAHLREQNHGKAFYALCQHMEPDYHQWEFDLRLWLTAQDAG